MLPPGNATSPFVRSRLNDTETRNEYGEVIDNFSETLNFVGLIDELKEDLAFGGGGATVNIRKMLFTDYYVYSPDPAFPSTKVITSVMDIAVDDRITDPSDGNRYRVQSVIDPGSFHDHLEFILVFESGGN